MNPNPWQSGLPRYVKRQNNHILFQVQLANGGDEAYRIDDRWVQKDTFDLIEDGLVLGWRLPIPKICRFGHHPIDEVVDRGLAVYSEVGGRDTYACFACAQVERLREFASSGVLTSQLLLEASLRSTRLAQIQAFFSGERLGESAPEYWRSACRMALRLVDEEAACGTPLSPDEEYDVWALTRQRASSDELDRHARSLFLGPHEFWFQRLEAAHQAIRSEFKVWERQVWFGGEDRSMDPRYTSPYPGLEDMLTIRSYKKCKGGSGHEIDLTSVCPTSLQHLALKVNQTSLGAEVNCLIYKVFFTAGRAIFQLEDESGAYVSFILDETSPCATGGLQGVSTTAENAVYMIKRAVSDWQDGKINFLPAKHRLLY